MWHIWGRRKTHKFLVEKYRRKRNHSEDIDIYRRIIIKFILKIGRRG
jgi:hypothetical protein